MNNAADSPTSSKQECFRPPFQITGDSTAGGSNEKHKKKRSKIIRLGEPVSSSHLSGCLKPKSAKKPEPNAPKITPPCSECGKQFWSWKALFGHMRCHPERQWRGINPPANFRRPVSPENPEHLPGKVLTEEDHEVATCLLMLANGSSAMDAPSATIDRDMLCSGNYFTAEPSWAPDADGCGPSGSNCRFECSSCKKVFGSRQALGGHRASHKNIKGCFAIARSDGEDEDRCGINNDDRGGAGGAEDKMAMGLGHQCSICLRVFSSGQALGGHKRCHWEKGEEPSPLGLNPLCTREGSVLLDLNRPAPSENDGGSSSTSSNLALDLRLGI